MLIFVLGPAPGDADETYTIKNRETAKGDKIQSNKQSTETMMLKVEDSQGNVLQEKNETVKEKYAYQETVLEKPPEKSKATRLRRAYDLAEVTKGDDKQTLPYQGKTVLIEKKGEKYQFQMEGGEELTGAGAEFLEKEFNRNKSDLDWNKLLIPKKPVKVQESWALDTDAFCKDLEETNSVEINGAKSKAVAKLVKAYKQSGRQFGIIDVHLEFPILALKMGEMKISLDQGARFVADVTLDACIDGSVNGGDVRLALHMEGQGELAQGEMKFKVTFKADMKGQETQKELARE
jgi:hypothetical protein